MMMQSFVFFTDLLLFLRTLIISVLCNQIELMLIFFTICMYDKVATDFGISDVRHLFTHDQIIDSHDRR